ncbi:CRISPR-associated endoribonuclease Cas6 [Caldiplasma sukawensis]
MSRLVLQFSTKENEITEDSFNKHYIQSLIYGRLNSQGNLEYHKGNRFRFFSFSDVFPSGPMKKGDIKKLIISSPDDNLIGLLAKSFVEDDEIYIGKGKMKLNSVKIIRLTPFRRMFISGSPVVLYKDNKKNLFFSIRDGDSLSFFIQRLKENAIKKYNQFSGKTPRFAEGPIFDFIKLKKEVSIKIEHRGGDFYIIGSLWEKLGVTQGRRIDMDFYRFIMDCGIGEKNSLGFGFINPIRGE